MNPRPTTVLAADGVTVRFGGLLALDDVSVELPAGRITGVIGPNGAGKSTLVNVLCGMTSPARGTVGVDGRLVRRWSLSRAARSGIARSFQESRAFYGRTVAENLAVAGVRSAEARRRVDEILHRLDLTRYADVNAEDLPYGALRRLGVAIPLTTDPRVLLLDEPAVGLTGDDLERLSTIITQLSEQGVTILLVDHNMRFLMGTVDHVIALESGRLLGEGTPQEIQADSRVVRAYLGGTVDAAD